MATDYVDDDSTIDVDPKMLEELRAAAAAARERSAVPKIDDDVTIDVDSEMLGELRAAAAAARERSAVPEIDDDVTIDVDPAMLASLREAAREKPESPPRATSVGGATVEPGPGAREKPEPSPWATPSPPRLCSDPSRTRVSWARATESRRSTTRRGVDAYRIR